MTKEYLDGRYIVADNGTITSRSSGKLMACSIDSSGYRTCNFWTGEKHLKRSVHRVVAEVFIPNPDSKRVVNHKDGNKLNNALDNLEWMTDSENLMHAYDLGLYKAERKLSVEEVHDILMSPDAAGVMHKKYPQVTAMHIRHLRRGFYLLEYKRSPLYNPDAVYPIYHKIKSGRPQINFPKEDRV